MSVLVCFWDHWPEAFQWIPDPRSSSTIFVSTSRMNSVLCFIIQFTFSTADGQIGAQVRTRGHYRSQSNFYSPRGYGMLFRLWFEGILTSRIRWMYARKNVLWFVLFYTNVLPDPRPHIVPHIFPLYLPILPFLCIFLKLLPHHLSSRQSCSFAACSSSDLLVDNQRICITLSAIYSSGKPSGQ